MLELKNVCASYGKKQILYDITADLEKGKITSIIGPNGCGKTTLLKAIVGILQISGGNVIADGVDLSGLSSKETAQKIAYLAQGRAVPDMTVRQIVLHGRFAHLGYPRVYSARDKDIAHRALRQMKIEHLKDIPLTFLSGGMRQNVYIAMALTQDTDYILLDEPTTYLDIANCLSLMENFKKLANDGKGVITVLHDLTLAMQYSDKILLMNDGRIVGFDTPENIYNSGLLENVFGVGLRRTETDNGYAYFYDKPKGDL